MRQDYSPKNYLPNYNKMRREMRMLIIANLFFVVLAIFIAYMGITGQIEANRINCATYGYMADCRTPLK